MTPRRFPPPWTVEETALCFIVRDHNGQALAFVLQLIAIPLVLAETLGPDDLERQAEAHGYAKPQDGKARPKATPA